MTRPLSNDLRRRVVTAVVDGGMTRRGAAKRFGIAPSTAIKWVHAWRRTGSYRPRAQGGRQAFAADRGARRGGPRAPGRDPGHDPGGDRRSPGERARGAGLPERRVALLSPPRHHLQKKRRTPASSNELTCCDAGAPGSRPSPISTLKGSSSSMRQGLPPRWRDAAAGLCAGIAAGRRCLMGTGRPPPSSARSG